MSNTKPQINVVIADDHPLFRQGLRQALDVQPRFRVVGEAHDGPEALRLIKECNADVATLDIEMPGIDGLEVARSLRQYRASTELVVLTGHKDEDIFDLAMQLGIKGYMLKDSAAADIVSCIQTVLQGRHYISPRFSECLFRRGNHAATSPEQKRPVDVLTAAEQRILRLLADTKTNKEIASELFISQRTVETHRRNICEKLNLRGVHRLLQFAFQQKSALATLSSFSNAHASYRRGLTSVSGT